MNKFSLSVKRERKENINIYEDKPRCQVAARGKTWSFKTTELNLLINKRENLVVLQRK